ncbi:hypothetical protein QWY93_05110 [Echinicola jeungdonensis]|uniref:DUF4382 domain-containing protein n=1 Tax=Echinicola jeungdonensis TaxID=709343 RepID=A0ABV5J5B6_9BACT|nr:hypothetical protein [Echinicola jeungdonensis]MDN3668703.1 hypothetical protein [Echinicola jeungdonensis]
MMTKRLMMMGLMAVSGWAMISCNQKSEESPQANLNVHARAIAENENQENARIISGANIISMDVAFGNVNLKGSSEGDSDILVPISAGTDFQLNLVNSALPLSKPLGTVMVEQGNYSGISLQFKQDESLTEADKMFEKTFLIEGNVNEQLLSIYTNGEEILNAAAEGSSLSLEGNQDVYLNFDLNRLFQEVDLSLAVDGDNDGTIEIEPTNQDGNRNIYLTIIGNLQNALFITKN